MVLASQDVIPSIDAHQQVALTFIPTVQHATLKVIPKQKITGGKREVYIGKWKTIQEPYLEQEQVLVILCDSVDDKYRFGFNGKEKVNEIAGLGNHNTAEFWEYDTRLGRRWNLDPKPQITLSDYSVFKNNPVYYTDLKGDTAVANNLSTKEGSSINAKYVGGKWINSENRAAINLDDLTEDSKNLLEAYSEINKVSKLGLLYNEINNTETDIELKYGEKSEIKLGKKIEIFISKSIELNKNMFEKEDNRNNITGKMAHELGHAYDFLQNGRINFDNFDFKVHDNGAIEEVNHSEVYAIYFENIYRNHKGWGLRQKISEFENKFDEELSVKEETTKKGVKIKYIDAQTKKEDGTKHYLRQIMK